MLGGSPSPPPPCMRRPRRTFALACAAVIVPLAGLLGLGVGMPEAAACALVDVSGLQPGADGILVEPGQSAQAQAEFADLLAGARARIGQTFGPPRARPIVVLRDSERAFGVLPLNAYGSTSFVGSRACVVIGPRGRNLDVIAHELMHAELFERVGSWRRFTSVPTWFDEGLAMQVDHRPAYDLPPDADTAFARGLRTERDFFASASTDAQLTQRYAAAKAEVGRSLAAVGPSGVYARLERLRQGERFSDVLDAAPQAP